MSRDPRLPILPSAWTRSPSQLRNTRSAAAPHFMDTSYRERLRRLAARWNPGGVLIGDARAHAAVKLLRERPEGTPVASLVEAQRVYKAAVHPVLDQPIPSAFRHSSFLPITSILALGMVASKSTGGLLLCARIRPAHPRCLTRRLTPARPARVAAATTGSTSRTQPACATATTPTPRVR
eukprot:1965209-Prymnesium_polylepis.1